MNAKDAYEERKERLKVSMDGSSEIIEKELARVGSVRM
jgi:hypothetical protein